MSRGFIIAMSRFNHYPLLVGIKLCLFWLGEEDVNFRWQLLDIFQGSRGDNSNDALSLEAVLRR